MKYGSLFSGIEAASVAWHGFGWEPQFFAEIEPFPCSVLAHHYPSVPNHGDVTKFQEWPDYAIDVLVGGSPCQSFSIAGLRKGLADPRGNLMLIYLAIVARYRPKWMVWENVPGVLSSNGGRDFGTFLGALGQLGYGFSYRVLDAQFTRVGDFPFAVPQRRRRVFVVGHLGDWRPAAAVLFDGESLRGNPPPRREAGQRASTSLSTGTRGYGDFELTGGMIPQPPVIMSSGQANAEIRTDGGAPSLTCLHEAPVVAHTLRAQAQSSNRADAETFVPQPIAFGHQNSARQGISASSEITPTLDKSKTPAVAYPINTQIAMRHEALGEGTGLGIGGSGDPGYTLQAGHSHAVGVFFAGQGAKAGGIAYDESVSPTLKASDSGTNRTPSAHIGMAVRRLTPTECERLQGFPDGYTLVPHRNKPAADGPRYKALGNSMAVNVMQWIGERIQLVEEQL